MDGVLARANNLLITTLWCGFNFVMVPLGLKLTKVFPPSELAAVFAMIWGSYIACDSFAEIIGSYMGNQKIRVWGVGDVNRKSIAGTVAGFLAALALCLWVVSLQNLGTPWIGLAVLIALSNTVFELYSPRGTDDFTMATANALICLAFGLWLH
jgi:dolichol kinase